MSEIDYSLYDPIDEFRVIDAAYLWCGKEPGSRHYKDIPGDVRIMADWIAKSTGTKTGIEGHLVQGSAIGLV